MWSVAAIEGGAAAPSLVEAVRTREAEIARLRAELDDPDPANAPPNPRNRVSSHHANLRLTPRSRNRSHRRGGPRSDEMAQDWRCRVRPAQASSYVVIS
jgi:hypothetical protein